MTPKPFSPLPFHKQPGNQKIVTSTGRYVALCDDDADAAYIVNACNNLPAMVKALEKITEATDPEGAQRTSKDTIYEIASDAVAAMRAKNGYFKGEK